MVTAADRYREAWTYYSKTVSVRLAEAEIRMMHKEIEDICPTCDRNRERLHRLANVVGVGVSWKLKGYEVTTKPVIAVFVREKIPLYRLKEEERIPPEIGGVETDVVEAGVPELRLSFRSRIRPAQPGYSIGHEAITAGTLGCLVRDRKTGEALLLSNNHVLANSNNAKTGDPIVQPGPTDGGRDPYDTVGTLRRFVPIVSADNLVDAAVAAPTAPNLVTPEIAGGIGIPGGWRRIRSVGDYVQKVGRTTQHTAGIVTAYNATISPLNYPGVGNATFVQSIVTTGMSRGGDSGSLLLDMEKKAVGLLFAGMSFQGREVVTYYNDIYNVLSLLDVELITA